MAKDDTLPDPLLSQHPIAIRLGRLTEGILDFYELNVTAKTPKDMKDMEQLWKEYPKVCAAKMRAGTTILGKVIPAKSVTPRREPDKPHDKPKPVNLTAKQLKDLGLTQAQLRAIAGIGVDVEAEVVKDAK